MLFKKSVSSVVATSLILVLVVIAVVGYQGWFNTYSSEIMVGTETTSDSGLDNILKIESLIGSNLYIINNIIDNLSINRIAIDGNVCNLTNVDNLTIGMNTIVLVGCLDNLSTNRPEISLTTDQKIVEKYTFIDDDTVASSSSSSYSDCTLNGTIVVHDNSAVFYNSTLGSVCTGILRTCNDGNLNGSSSFNMSTCTVMSGSLTCITDNDGDGQISSACAKYPMTNITHEGDLDVNDNNATIIDDKCWLKDNKSSCESNLIIDGCGSGTVLDAGTGLCWQRDMSTAGQKNWVDAKIYCETTLDGLGGNSDWRLPTRQELFSIRDLSRYDPTIIGGNNDKFTSVMSSYYWTISTYGILTAGAWSVNFLDGVDTGGSKTFNIYVICVRN